MSWAIEEGDPVEWSRTNQRPESTEEVRAPSTVLGGPGEWREPQRTATSESLRGDWRGTSRASP